MSVRPLAAQSRCAVASPAQAYAGSMRRSDQPARTTAAIGGLRTDLYAVCLSDRLAGHGAAGSIGAGLRHRF